MLLGAVLSIRGNSDTTLKRTYYDRGASIKLEARKE